jgi:hypothetical protein
VKALTLAVGVVIVALCAATASATIHRHASLRALSLTPPTFRGSGFAAHERVTVSSRGLRVTPVRLRANAHGRFLIRLGALPACKAWTVRAIGVRSGLAVYRHVRCASLKTDVRGVVRRGPTRSVCKVGEPCSAPAAGVTVQALESGSVVAETATDGKGQFSFSLADGDYTIQALGRGSEPKMVHVETSSPVQLAFLLDTGIR